MKVARLHGIRDLRLHEEPTPSPAAGEDLVRVSVVGVCGSDVHWFAEGGIGTASLKFPLVMGHEFVGVPETGPLRGRRVAVDPAIPCGHCDFCLEGHPNLCSNMRFAADGAWDGALREYVAWPAHCLIPLPDSVSDDEGALLEPLGVGIFAADLGHIRPAQTIGVFGCGTVGLLTLQVARAAGATRLFATERLEHRMALARSYGATVFHADDPDRVQAILKLTGGKGVDLAFDAAGADAAVNDAIAAAKPGARVVLIGIPTEDRTSFKASEARRKGLTLMLVRRAAHVYQRALQMTQAGLVDLRPLATHHFPLEQTQTAFETAQRREGVKVIINPTG